MLFEEPRISIKSDMNIETAIKVGESNEWRADVTGTFT
jgi:hypothetical protein